MCNRVERESVDLQQVSFGISMVNGAATICMAELTEEQRKQAVLFWRLPWATTDPRAAGPAPGGDQAAGSGARGGGEEVSVGPGFARPPGPPRNEGAAAAAAEVEGDFQGGGGAKNRRKKQSLAARCKWVEEFSAREWMDYVLQNPMRPLPQDKGQQYRVQYYEGDKWLYMNEHDSATWMRVALTSERKDDAVWRKGPNGDMQYSVWWTGALDGIQKNWRSQQFRPIRIVPVEGAGPADDAVPEAQWGGKTWDGDQWPEEDWTACDNSWAPPDT
jgi:hypothetical protein